MVSNLYLYDKQIGKNLNICMTNIDRRPAHHPVTSHRRRYRVTSASSKHVRYFLPLHVFLFNNHMTEKYIRANYVVIMYIADRLPIYAPGALVYCPQYEPRRVLPSHLSRYFQYSVTICPDRLILWSFIGNEVNNRKYDPT